MRCTRGAVGWDFGLPLQRGGGGEKTRELRELSIRVLDEGVDAACRLLTSKCAYVYVAASCPGV